METGLKDKIVIVTGGAAGIGRATVEVLIEEEAIPVIVDKDEKRVREFSELLQSQHNEHLFLLYDLTNDDNCRKAVERTIERYQRLDVLINNAGGNDSLDIDTTTPDEFRKSLDRNLVHYYIMTHYAWPHLKQTRGNVIFVGSKVGEVGEGKTTAYAAAKGGVVGMMRELATKSTNEGLGIRLNCIIPAEVRTTGYENYVETHFENPEEGYKQLAQRIPFGKRPTTPREVANAIVFLASNKLSSHTIGQEFHPDGGYVHLDRNI